MNTYIITLATTNGDYFRYTYKGQSTPYALIDSLVIKHHANYVKCANTTEGWYLEHDYE